MPKEALHQREEGDVLTEGKSRIFKYISHRITGIPSDFHGSLNQNSRNQGLDSLLNDFSKSGFFYMVKQIAGPGSMHETGCLGLVHWDDPEG